MGKYPSGISMKEMFKYEREELEMAASARALERLAEKHCVGISTNHFKEYMALLMEEKAK